MSLLSFSTYISFYDFTFIPALLAWMSARDKKKQKTITFVWITSISFVTKTINRDNMEFALLLFSSHSALWLTLQNFSVGRGIVLLNHICQSCSSMIWLRHTACHGFVRLSLTHFTPSFSFLLLKGTFSSKSLSITQLSSSTFFKLTFLAIFFHWVFDYGLFIHFFFVVIIFFYFPNFLNQT